MSEYLTFGGVDSREFGVVLFEGSTFGAPQREYTAYSIPARSGALYVDGKRYLNQPHSYNCVIYQNYTSNIENFRNFLMSKVGYKRLEDSIHPLEYYQAIYNHDFAVVTDTERNMGKFTLEFERKPQRYLKSGETKTTLTTSGSITNPTLFASRPLLRVYGTGVVGIGNNSIKITSADQYTDIDCELMEAFKGTVSCNKLIELSLNDFPVLQPGANGITLGTGITKVEITPRWYKL